MIFYAGEALVLFTFLYFNIYVKSGFGHLDKVTYYVKIPLLK